MTNNIARRGYAASTSPGARRAGRANTTCLYLIAAVALMFSLMIAVTAVSIGIARAGALY